jgi:hypothetical protein
VLECTADSDSRRRTDGAHAGQIGHPSGSHPQKPTQVNHKVLVGRGGPASGPPKPRACLGNPLASRSELAGSTSCAVARVSGTISASKAGSQSRGNEKRSTPLRCRTVLRRTELAPAQGDRACRPDCTADGGDQEPASSRKSAGTRLGAATCRELRGWEQSSPTRAVCSAPRPTCTRRARYGRAELFARLWLSGCERELRITQVVNLSPRECQGRLRLERSHLPQG